MTITIGGVPLGPWHSRKAARYIARSLSAEFLRMLILAHLK